MLKYGFENRVKELNELFGKGAEAAAQAEKVLEEVKGLVKDYNATLRKIDYDTFIDSGEAFKMALLVGRHDLVRLVVSKDETTNIRCAVVERVPYDMNNNWVDLKALEAYNTKGQLAVNGQWVFKLAAINKLLAMRMVRDLGGDVAKAEKEYRIKAQAADLYDENKSAMSNKNAAATLQKVLDMVVFEDNGQGLNKYKVETAHVNFIDKLYGTRKLAGDVGGKSDSDSRIMTAFIAMAHMIVADKKFQVVIPTKKK